MLSSTRSIDSRRAGFLLTVSVVAVLAACGSQSERDTVETNVDSVSEFDSYRNLDPSVTYVGMDACVQCHAARGSTYVKSQMGRSFKPATRSASVANWDNADPVYDSFKDFHYLPFARGDSLYLLEYRLSDGDTTFKRLEKIDYIVGSGQHTNSHMMEVNGYVYQIPITWYAQEGRWDQPPGFAGGHSWRFERAIEVECMTCHNGMPDYVEGSDNRYAELPHGINCERCHGPGSLHVAEKKVGKVVDTRTEIDRTIVNPRKLPLSLQFDICQRCHLQGVAVPKEGASFTDFRPGMRLGDVFDVYLPRYTDSLSQFIMASHPDRLRMSSCRVPSNESPGTMDPLPCTMCHNPHVPIEALGRDAYNAPCVGCHAGNSDLGPPTSNVQRPVSRVSPGNQDFVATECTEDTAVRVAHNDDCSSCHMPVSSSIDIPHVRITDHNIRIVKPDEGGGQESDGLDQKEFVRLASLTSRNPTPRLLGEGYLAYYEQYNNVRQFLDSAAVQLEEARKETSDLSLARALVRLWYLQEEYDAIAVFADGEDLSLVNDAWTFYRIGEAYAELGRHPESRDFYQMAVDLGPDHLWFRTKLASAYVSLGEVPKAIVTLDEVLRDNPEFHHAYNNRGFAYLLMGNYEQAESDFKATLARDPDAEQALANLASLYFNTGRPGEAKLLMEHLVELKPDNEQYLQFKQAVEEAL